jgi:hypothetical protein
MKEDILEQLIDGYFLRKPSTFTKHNIKYRPDLVLLEKKDKNKYSVHSDIDIISINTISKEVNVVSCKSWQGGFNIQFYLNQLANPNNHNNLNSGRAVWKSFREITNPIWAKAFRDKVFEETNSKKFNYYIAVTKLLHQELKQKFCNCESFLNLLSNDGEFDVNIGFLTFEDIFNEIQNSEMSTTIESTEIGRILQLFKSSGLKISH